MTAPGVIEVNVGWYIPSGDYIGTLVNVMAGRLLVASRPSALQRPVGGWPGRPKQAPGHDGAWRIEVNVGWYIPSGDDIGTLVNVMAGRLLVASRPSALQRPVGGWPGRPKQALGHDGTWRIGVQAGWYVLFSIIWPARHQSAKKILPRITKTAISGWNRHWRSLCTNVRLSQLELHSRHSGFGHYAPRSVLPDRLAVTQMQTFDRSWQYIALSLGPLAPGCLGENNKH